MRKQPTFCDSTTVFPAKMTCEEQPQKFYTAGFSLRILVAGERCDVTGEYLKEAPCLNNKQS